MSRRLRRVYGAGPLHLLALLASFAIAGAAVVRWLDAGPDAVNIALWFLGALLGHDLVLVPLYTGLDRLATGLVRPPLPQHGPAADADAPRRGGDLRPPWGAAYVRVPALLSALLFAVFFPLILAPGSATYRAATGHALPDYLSRWLVASGLLFGLSGLAFALRLARERRAGEPPSPPTT